MTVSVYRHSVWALTMAAFTAMVMGIMYVQSGVTSEHPGVEHVVEIKEFAFVPAVIRVRPGDTIKWINRDLAPHTATATDKSWDTKRLNQGNFGSAPVTPDLVTDYYCRFHPAMTAKLEIFISD